MRRRDFVGGAIGGALALPLLGTGAWPTPAAAAAALDRLAEPGVHAIMRHANAPGVSDPAAVDLADCATQRNLDAGGRAQARATGRALGAAGVRFDRVLTSQFCRCRETAELLDAGPVTAEPALNAYMEARQRRLEHAEAVRRLLAAAGDETLLLVTHQVNISGLVGRATEPGEMLVIRLSPNGAEVLGALLATA